MVNTGFQRGSRTSCLRLPPSLTRDAKLQLRRRLIQFFTRSSVARNDYYRRRSYLRSILNLPCSPSGIAKCISCKTFGQWSQHVSQPKRSVRAHELLSTLSLTNVSTGVQNGLPQSDYKTIFRIFIMSLNRTNANFTASYSLSWTGPHFSVFRDSNWAAFFTAVLQLSSDSAWEILLIWRCSPGVLHHPQSRFCSADLSARSVSSCRI